RGSSSGYSRPQLEQWTKDEGRKIKGDGAGTASSVLGPWALVLGPSVGRIVEHPAAAERHAHRLAHHVDGLAGLAPRPAAALDQHLLDDAWLRLELPPALADRLEELVERAVQ